MKNYGLTLPEYDTLWERQGGQCAICGMKEMPGERRLAIDHDHACCSGTKSCGKCVRGLLCAACNQGVGCFADDPVLLSRAISYLAENRGHISRTAAILVADWGSAVIPSDPVTIITATDGAGRTAA